MNQVKSLYGVYDTVMQDYRFFYSAQNDRLAVRNAFLSLQVPLKDSEIHCLGEFSKRNDLKLLNKKRIVSWNVYSLPETPAEALAPLESEELINAILEAQIANRG